MTERSDADPARTARTRNSIRPTVFGVVLVILLVLTALWRPAVADPTVAALLWSGLAASVVVGLIWPVIAARRFRIEITSAPTDTVVGSPVHLLLSTTAVPLECAVGMDPEIGELEGSQGVGAARLEMHRRGVYEQLPVRVVIDGPFAMLRVTRCMSVALPRLMYVGPRPVEQVAPVADVPRSAVLNPGTGVGNVGDTVRSVRPYVTGDPAHLVHWPSSARTGQLVVRELEPPPVLGVVIVVDLGPNVDDPAAADRRDADGSAVAHQQAELAVSRAAGAAQWALAEGAVLVLCTCDGVEGRVSTVDTSLAVQRQLALASQGTVPAPPSGWPVLRCTPEAS